jgi:hypothetical protein
MRHPWRECDISEYFLSSFARQELAALAIQPGFASRVALFHMFRKCGFYFMVTFFIVSILIAGMASKQGSINFGQENKAPEPDSLFVNNVSVSRRGRATPPSQASLSLFAILPLLLFIFLPHNFCYAPPKNSAQKNNCVCFCSQKNVFAPIFLLPIFLWVPNSSCDIMSHKAALGATSPSKMRPHVTMRH